MSRRVVLVVLVLIMASVGFEATDVGAQFRLPAIPGIPGLSRSEPEQNPMDMFRAFEDMDEPPRWLRHIAEQEGLTHQLRILEEGVPQVF